MSRTEGNIFQFDTLQRILPHGLMEKCWQIVAINVSGQNDIVFDDYIGERLSHRKCLKLNAKYFWTEKFSKFSSTATNLVSFDEQPLEAEALRGHSIYCVSYCHLVDGKLIVQYDVVTVHCDTVL